MSTVQHQRDNEVNYLSFLNRNIWYKIPINIWTIMLLREKSHILQIRFLKAVRGVEKVKDASKQTNRLYDLSIAVAVDTDHKMS